MGTLLFSRELPSGRIAFASFLLDVYCLGVKDVVFGVTSRHEYDWEIHANLAESGVVMQIAPEYARKLIEEAVEYARGLGFAAPSDYQRARLIFGDIDAAACLETFEFGKDGKPLYIAGPHDSAAKRERIVAVLTSRLGAEGFHFIVPLGGGASVFAGDFIEKLGPDEEWEE